MIPMPRLVSGNVLVCLLGHGQGMRGGSWKFGCPGCDLQRSVASGYHNFTPTTSPRTTAYSGCHPVDVPPVKLGGCPPVPRPRLRWNDKPTPASHCQHASKPTLQGQSPAPRARRRWFHVNGTPERVNHDGDQDIYRRCRDPLRAGTKVPSRPLPAQSNSNPIQPNPTWPGNWTSLLPRSPRYLRFHCSAQFVSPRETTTA